MIEIQGLQIVAASFGALDVSLTDATIQYVVDDLAATRVLIDGLFAPGFAEDPLAVMTVYQSAWSEVARLGDSPLSKVPIQASTRRRVSMGHIATVGVPTRPSARRTVRARTWRGRR